MPAPRPDRFPAAELAVVGLLVTWNLAANLWIPEAGEIPLSLAGAGAVVAVARRSALTWGELGLQPQGVRAGVRVGTGAAGVVLVVVTTLALVPATQELLADDRFVDVETGEMLYDTLLRIPLATAVGEEIAFRGVLLGMLLRWMSPRSAVVISSTLFGLWHILPGIDALATTTLEAERSRLVDAGAVAGQVVVTGFAGAALCWLRFRGRHLAAPVLAHWSLNGGAYAAGWLLVRNGVGAA